MKNRKQFKTSEILDNLQNIGPWSLYGLAIEALHHYFPEEFDLSDDGSEFHKDGVLAEIKLMESLGCNMWDELIKKYHNEIGYYRPNGLFGTLEVNEA
jgi:hypothetical protein